MTSEQGWGNGMNTAGYLLNDGNDKLLQLLELNETDSDNYSDNDDDDDDEPQSPLDYYKLIVTGIVTTMMIMKRRQDQIQRVYNLTTACSK